ncbi:MAG TPA: tRNA pseudouridine(38-40) synthase TruA [Verrucomicrobiae bacterium]|nr:tRNA pseudouridine(38-40) synthase TruA [Verrucomicrobiae bacterium]
MTRWAAGVEYVGTAYSGWQWQLEAPSVQAAVERVLSNVANHVVKLTAAGRTDAGVHAYNQVVHFDSDAPRAPIAWQFGGNSQLPRDISLRWVQFVGDDFHARYGATARRYRYVMQSAAGRPALLDKRVAWVPGALAVEPMHRAAQALVGEHDFSAYRDSMCQSLSPVRRVHSITVRQHGEFAVLDIEANAFLHHMVRNIAGVLMAIGRGRQPEAWAATVLEGRVRAQGGVTAEPGGLYFVGPVYPERFGLPPAPRPWFPA